MSREYVDSISRIGFKKAASFKQGIESPISTTSKGKNYRSNAKCVVDLRRNEHREFNKTVLDALI